MLKRHFGHQLTSDQPASCLPVSKFGNLLNSYTLMLDFAKLINLLLKALRFVIFYSQQLANTH